MVRGTVIAPSEKELYNIVKSRGLWLVSFSKEREFLRGLTLGKLKRVELMNAFYQLYAMTRTGIPLDTALYTIADQSTSPTAKTVFKELAISISSGYMLSEAMENYRRFFPNWIISAVRSGEVSGQLDKVFLDLAKFLEWQQKIVDDIKNALFYPSIVFVAFIGLILVTSFYLLPSLVEAFRKVQQTTGGQLPALAQFLIDLNEFIRSYWPIIFSAPLIFFVAFRLSLKIPVVANFVDELKYSIPAVGGILRAIELSRFCRYFALLYKSGVDISKILDILSEITSSVNLSRAIKRVKMLIEEGKSISEAVAEVGHFPPILVQGFVAAEKSAQIPFMLEQISDYFDREIALKVKRFVTALEPMFLLAIAGIVGMVVISLISTIYSMITRIGA